MFFLFLVRYDKQLAVVANNSELYSVDSWVRCFPARARINYTALNCLYWLLLYFFSALEEEKRGQTNKPSTRTSRSQRNSRSTTTPHASTQPPDQAAWDRHRPAPTPHPTAHAYGTAQAQSRRPTHPKMAAPSMGGGSWGCACCGRTFPRAGNRPRPPASTSPISARPRPPCALRASIFLSLSLPVALLVLLGSIACVLQHHCYAESRAAFLSILSVRPHARFKLLRCAVLVAQPVAVGGVPVPVAPCLSSAVHTPGKATPYMAAISVITL